MRPPSSAKESSPYSAGNRYEVVNSMIDFRTGGFDVIVSPATTIAPFGMPAIDLMTPSISLRSLSGTEIGSIASLGATSLNMRYHIGDAALTFEIIKPTRLRP